MAFSVSDEASKRSQTQGPLASRLTVMYIPVSTEEAISKGLRVGARVGTIRVAVGAGGSGVGVGAGGIVMDVSGKF